jgi:cell division protein FtsB
MHDKEEETLSALEASIERDRKRRRIEERVLVIALVVLALSVVYGMVGAYRYEQSLPPCPFECRQE